MLTISHSCRVLFALLVLARSVSSQTAADLQRLMHEAPRQLDPPPAPQSARSFDDTDSKISDDLRRLLAAPGTTRSTTDNRRHAVVLHCPNADAAARIARQVRASGVKSVLQDKSDVLTRLSAALLRELARSTDIEYISAQGAVSPFDLPSLDDALRVMKAPALHAQGRQGQGIRVGIIDMGFSGYQKLQKDGRLPAPSATALFGDLDEDTYAAGPVHGAACAEIIHAAAPAAQLFLARIDGTDQSLLEAAEWMAAQQVDIVSLSAGTYLQELKGRDRMSRAVDEQMERDGRLWVVAAGNLAGAHWAFSASPRVNGKWVPIGPLGEIMLPVAGTSPARGDFHLQIAVQWDDWGPNGGNESGQDLDACLYSIDSPGVAPSLVECSRNEQRNHRSAPPMERLSLGGSRAERKPYYLALRAVNITRPVRIHVFLGPDGAHPAVASASGSISSPATARQALAVGALDLSTRTVASYSSQGPTDDARVKPEVVAPSGIVTAAYPGGFHGTSAAAPFVAGFAASLASGSASLRGARLREAVLRSAVEIGTPSPNSTYGYGFVVAGDSPSTAPATPTPADNTGDDDEAVLAARLRPWGGKPPDQLLAKLFDRAGEQWPLGAKLVTGRDRYRVGDGLKIGLRVNQDSAALLCLRHNGGEFEVLPITADEGRLKAARSYLVPSGQNSLHVEAEMLGRSDALVIIAVEPLDWRHWLKPGAALGVARTSFEVVR